MPYNPNAYYNPLANHGIFGGPLGVSGLYSGHGIFGIYGSEADFYRDLQGRLDTPAPTPAPPPPGVRTPVVPPKPAPGWEGVERPDPMIEIERRMAAGGPIYNPTTDKFENVPAEETGGGVGGVKGGAGSDGQAAQSYGILPWLGVGLYGLNTLGNLYLGWRSLNQAQEQFNYQRNLANQNLAASIQAYNDAQRRRLRGLGGFTEEEIDRMMKEQGRELKDTRKRK